MSTAVVGAESEQEMGVSALAMAPPVSPSPRRQQHATDRPRTSPVTASSAKPPPAPRPHEKRGADTGLKTHASVAEEAATNRDHEEESGLLNTPGFGTALCTVLEKLVASFDQRTYPLNAFHAVRKPSMSISEYIMRLRRYARCSDACYVVALIFMDRAIQGQGENFAVNSLSAHRVLLTCLVVASKYVEDMFYSNEFYARVGGVAKEELGRLEMRLLQAMNFQLAVTPREFEIYLGALARNVPAPGDAAEPPSASTEAAPVSARVPEEQESVA